MDCCQTRGSLHLVHHIIDRLLFEPSTVQALSLIVSNLYDSQTDLLPISIIKIIGDAVCVQWLHFDWAFQICRFDEPFRALKRRDMKAASHCYILKCTSDTVTMGYICGERTTL